MSTFNACQLLPISVLCKRFTNHPNGMSCLESPENSHSPPRIGRHRSLGKSEAIPSAPFVNITASTLNDGYRCDNKTSSINTSPVTLSSVTIVSVNRSSVNIFFINISSVNISFLSPINVSFVHISSVIISYITYLL